MIPIQGPILWHDRIYAVAARWSGRAKERSRASDAKRFQDFDYYIRPTNQGDEEPTISPRQGQTNLSCNDDIPAQIPQKLAPVLRLDLPLDLY